MPPLNTEAQQEYFEVLLDVWAPPSVSRRPYIATLQMEQSSAHVVMLWWWLEHRIAHNSIGFRHCLLFLQKLHQSIWKSSCSILPSLTNDTPSYLNSTTWRGQSILPWLRTMFWDSAHLHDNHSLKNSKTWVYMATELLTLGKKYCLFLTRPLADHVLTGI